MTTFYNNLFPLPKTFCNLLRPLKKIAQQCLQSILNYKEFIKREIKTMTTDIPFYNELWRTFIPSLIRRRINTLKSIEPIRPDSRTLMKLCSFVEKPSHKCCL